MPIDYGIVHDDARVAVQELIDLGVQVDSVVTDPPYALVATLKRFANSPRTEKTENPTNPYGRTGRGFMGKRWDTGEVAHSPEFWRLVYDAMKPGAHLVAFGGTRTYHRLACAIEDAGFEIRDQIAWLYGSGFPKSHNAGDGWGTALKPAMEPIVLARKPLIGTVAENVTQHGVGAINVDGCRIEANDGANRARPPRTPNEILGGGKGASLTASPHNTAGRWPANVIHDSGDEVLEAFPDAKGQQGLALTDGSRKTNAIYGAFARNETYLPEPRGDTGSAARFFYCAKASKAERAGSKHPTVKPIALMRYLIRLVTPRGGTVLDPFAGSGTTLQAALEEGCKAIGIEREDEYVADIEARMAGVYGRMVAELLGE